MAPTSLFMFMVTTHVSVPLHAPDQLVKADPVFGVAVRVTDVPLTNELEQFVPQSIPWGEDFISPEPTPSFCRFKVNNGAKTALTVLFLLMVRMQELVPVHSPDQPVKADPIAGVAVKVTEAPLTNEKEHIVPQSIPDGVDVTVPEPVPSR